MPALPKAIFLAAALLAAGAEAQAQTAASRWLDTKPLFNWNEARGATPRGPKSEFAGEIADCEKRGAEETKKTPPTPETRQVTAAGWLGATVDKRAGNT